MRGRTSFDSFSDFRNEVLRLRSGPLSSPVDDIVEDLFHVEIDDDSEASMGDDDD